VASTTTQTSIANRALQLLGYQPISLITDNDRGARAMARAYAPVLLELLRSHPWSFAIKRAQIPASATAPIFGGGNYFPLPSDYLGFAPPDQVLNSVSGISPGGGTMAGYRDYQIENVGGVSAVVSHEPSPLRIRYVSSDVTEAQFDPCFAESLAAALAVATCEELTQSNTKLQNIQAILKAQLEMAKKRGAMESRPSLPPVDSWILARM
jgi:hypothetical protein